MTFFRLKRVGSREYVYEMRSFRNRDGEPRNEIVRYVGPVVASSRRAEVDLESLRGRAAVTDGHGESPQERRERKTRERADRAVHAKARGGDAGRS